MIRISRFTVIIWGMFAFLPCLLPLRAQAQTINAATCSSTDVQTALNNVKADGTIVIVPAGTCTWTSQVTYKQVYSTTIQGQTACTNTATINASCVDSTIIISAVKDQFHISAASGKSFRLTGFTFETSAFIYDGIFTIVGSTTQLRIDHNHFYHESAVGVVDGPLGVIDHNFFDLNTVQSTNNGIRVGNGGWNGYKWGDGSWADSSYFGSSKFLFFEDNTTYNGFINDCNDGGRFVIRNSYFHDAVLQGHEMESRMQGCRAFEVYGNTFYAEPNQQSGVSTSQGGLFRTGTGLFWRNTINYANFVTIHNDRSDTAHSFSAAASTCMNGADPSYNCWGYACNNLSVASGSVCSSTSSLPNSPSGFDGNTDLYGYPATQQVGRGKGDLFPQYDFNNPAFWSAGEPKWHHNQLEPLYLWQNTFTPPYGNNFFGSASPAFQKNRDYYMDYGGSNGVTSGTALPGACTPLQGFWNTTANTLYQCTATNTWTVYYQPYVYPHPLVAGSGTPPAPPTNVQAIAQ